MDTPHTFERGVMFTLPFEGNNNFEHKFQLQTAIFPKQKEIKKIRWCQNFRICRQKELHFSLLDIHATYEV